MGSRTRAVPHFRAHLEASGKQRKKTEHDRTLPWAEQGSLQKGTVATSRWEEKAARKTGSEVLRAGRPGVRENRGLSGREGEAGRREGTGGLQRQAQEAARGRNPHGISSSQPPSEERGSPHLALQGKKLRLGKAEEHAPSVSTH